MKRHLSKEGIIFLLGLSVALSMGCPLGQAQMDIEAEEDLRDPFVSPFESKFIPQIKQTDQQPEGARPLPRLEVQGIVWGSPMPQAIINHKVVKAGEMIEGVQIQDIQQGKIYLLFEGTQYILKAKKGAEQINPEADSITD